MAQASMSPSNLKNRRLELRSQRRWQAIQGVWRFLFISTLAGGLCWILALPEWNLTSNQQVEIEGNQLLSQAQIHHFLAFSYPQSLWQLKTNQLKDKLEQLPPIADTVITREILPPKLTVHIRERIPVALASSGQSLGFLDAQGVFIPKSFYQSSNQLKALPLKVNGFQSQYSNDWQELYPLLTSSSVKISALDWHNPSNLVLKTELGIVYCGAYTSQFAEKLKVLEQMRKIKGQVALDRIIYIDLTNPKYPSVKLKPQPAKSDKPEPVKNQ